MKMKHQIVLYDVEEYGFLHSVMIVSLNLSTNSSSPRQLKSALGNQSIALSIRTIRRRLFGIVYKAYRPRKKSKLTEATKRQQLTWVKSLKNCTVDGC